MPATEAKSASGQALNRCLQRLLQLCWFAVVPALLAGWVWRYLGAPLVSSPVSVLVGSFLLFTLLVRYWRVYLPGGRFLTELEPGVAVDVPRERLEAYAVAARLRAALTSRAARRRLQKRLSEAQRQELRGTLDALLSALRADRPDRVRRASDALARLAAPELRARSIERALSLVALIGCAAAAALVLRARWVQLHEVLGHSMLPSLARGDYVTENRWIHGSAGGDRSARRGDVVVIRDVSGEEVAKRVIGLPGDYIEMHGGRPIINGWEVPSCDAGRYFYLEGNERKADGRLNVEFLDDQAYLTVHEPPFAPVEPYEVPAGEVFVLGDNRAHSRDSRNRNLGKPRGVPLAELQGQMGFAIRRSRDGASFAFGRLAEPLSVPLAAPDIDTSDLDAAIRQCLASRPKQTRPPAPRAPLARAQAAAPEP